MIIWKIKDFKSLSAAELYDILSLRQTVFVIEQNCIYPDLDYYDQGCLHLTGFKDGKPVAYSRILPPNLKYPEASIGRVIVLPEFRGTNIANELVNTSIKDLYKSFGEQIIKIGAQAHLEKFYMRFGFQTISDPYDEDGIMHIDMKLICGDFKEFLKM